MAPRPDRRSRWCRRDRRPAGRLSSRSTGSGIGRDRPSRSPAPARRRPPASSARSPSSRPGSSDIEEMVGDAAQVRPGRRAQAVQPGRRSGRLPRRARRSGRCSRSTRPSATRRSISRVTPLLLRITRSASWRIRIRRPGASRDGEQRVVFGERQVVLGPQFLVEAAGDAGVRLEEGPPRLEPWIASRQWPGDPRGDGHGRDATPSSMPGTVRHGRIRVA